MLLCRLLFAFVRLDGIKTQKRQLFASFFFSFCKDLCFVSTFLKLCEPEVTKFFFFLILLYLYAVTALLIVACWCFLDSVQSGHACFIRQMQIEKCPCKYTKKKKKKVVFVAFMAASSICLVTDDTDLVGACYGCVLKATTRRNDGRQPFACSYTCSVAFFFFTLILQSKKKSASGFQAHLSFFFFFCNPSADAVLD